MNKSLTMAAFQQTLQVENQDPLAKVLRELASIKDLTRVTAQIKSPQPLGVWSGWSY
jgi:hypothetical protein